MVNERLVTADALGRLHLLQEKADLETELGRLAARAEIESLEKGFVAVARAYGERKGISYRSWRSAGVSAQVLERAGIRRTPPSPTPLPG